MLRALIAAIVSAVLTISATDVQAFDDGNAFKRSVDKSLATQGAPVVRVTGFAGDVHVKPGGAQAVSLHATLAAHDAAGLDQMRVDLHPSTDGVDIRAVTGGSNEALLARVTHGNRSIDLDITVPRGASVEVDQQVGDVTVAAPAGHVRVTERIGDITIRDIAGAVYASVTTGDVSISLAPQWNGASIDASAQIGDVTAHAPAALRSRAAAVAHLRARLGDVNGF
jgi:hypothetical protein